MADEPIRVVVVDDDDDFRTLLREIATNGQSLHVVGEDSNGERALEIIARTRPDLVVLDLALPGVDGLTLLPALATAAAPGKVVVVTMNDYPPLADMIRTAGAHAMVAKAPIRTLHHRLLAAAM